MQDVPCEFVASVQHIQHSVADSRLIQRSTRRVDLTAAGAVLREHAVPIAEAMGQMAEQVRQVNSNRPLSVGISTDLTAPWTTLVEGWINARGAPAVLERRPSRRLEPRAASDIDRQVSPPVADRLGVAGPPHAEQSRTALNSSHRPK